MSMNRFVGLGVFALSSSVLVTIAACDDSATTVPPGGTGGATVTPGQGGATGTVTGQGGSTTVTGKGGSTSTTTTPGQGGSTGTTTTPGQGGSTGTPGACSATTNLVAEALASTSTNWIGGDPASATDNPCGVQGAIYAYSDKGLDKVEGGTDASVQTPGLVDPPKGAERLSPCAAGSTKCCIKGATSKWPMSGTTADYTASVWGGGIGISLNDPGEGGAKQAYAGTATGFNIVLSGSLNGQAVRIGYTQSATDEAAPFVEKTGTGTYAVPFSGVTCPAWATTCVAPGNKPYDIQIQIVGGDSAGAFELCVDSITPII